MIPAEMREVLLEEARWWANKPAKPDYIPTPTVWRLGLCGGEESGIRGIARPHAGSPRLGPRGKEQLMRGSWLNQMVV
jgi:hypothetical protein